jgi:hypothetical protein
MKIEETFCCFAEEWCHGSWGKWFDAWHEFIRAVILMRELLKLASLYPSPKPSCKILRFCFMLSQSSSSPPSPWFIQVMVTLHVTTSSATSNFALVPINSSRLPLHCTKAPLKYQNGYLNPPLPNLKLWFNTLPCLCPPKHVRINV